jgi:hypothetical protein
MVNVGALMCDTPHAVRTSSGCLEEFTELIARQFLTELAPVGFRSPQPFRLRGDEGR